MNQNAQHCFLLDGKTILPINYKHQLLISLKKLNNINNKYCPCSQGKYRCHCQYLLNKNLKSTNNNKDNQINEEDLCSCSLQSIEKSSEDKQCKFTIAKRTNCRHHQSDQRINSTETSLITRIIPSINVIMGSNSANKNESYKSSSAITIIIKPFISSENHRKDPSLDENLSVKKRKHSSSSLKSTTKRISTCQSDQTLNKHRLSTFKDITRSIPLPTNINENNSSTILHSRTLLDIYRNKKQY